jgi:hypothetical protein
MTPRTPMLRQNLDWSGATNKDVFEYFGTEVIREWKINSLSNLENEARVYIQIVLGTNFEAVSTIEYNDRPFSKFATFIGRDIDEVIFKENLEEIFGKRPWDPAELIEDKENSSKDSASENEQLASSEVSPSEENQPEDPTENPTPPKNESETTEE